MNWKKIAEITLWAFNIILILNIWFFLEKSNLSASTSSIFIALGRITGLLAVYLVLSQLVLIGRVIWVERVFGHDKLVKFHKINGYFAFGLMILHPIFLTIGYSLENNINYFTQFINFILYFENVMLAAIALLIFVVVIGITIFRKRIKYEVWYYIHLSIYLAILLAFFHQLKNGGSFIGNPLFVYYWYFLYAFTVVNLIIFRFAKPVYNFYSQNYKVDKVVKESNNVLSVYITGKNLKAIKAYPGQFMILRFFQKGFWWQSHPFSLSCTPNENYLRITVKAVGDFTSQLPHLKKGTRVLIDGPHGLFMREAKDSKKAVLIAGGIGITPIYSFLESITAKKDLILLYSNKTKEDFVFKSKIDSIAKKYNLKTHYFTTQENSKGFIHGRITRENIEDLVPDFLQRDFFVCGPPEMINQSIINLKELGVPSQRIYSERFAL